MKRHIENDIAYMQYTGWEHMYCKAIIQKGHQVNLYVLSKSNEIKEFRHVFGHTIISFPAGRGLYYWESSPHLVGKLIIDAFERRVDICHIQSYYLPSYQYIAPLLKILKVPFVAQYHGGRPHDLLRRILNIIPLNLADRLLSVTRQEIKNLMLNYKVPYNKIAYVPNGVDTDIFTPIPKEKARGILGLEDDLKYVLFVGRLDYMKGLTTLIKSFKYVVNKNQNVRLIVVGTSSLQSYLEQLVMTIGLKNHVIFAGFQPDLHLWYSSADIFVLPSYEDTFPVALLEAMSSGLPCIATKVGGVPEIITKDVGILIPPRNHFLLSHAILKLLSDDQLRESLGKQARIRILANFSLWKLGERLIKIYDDVLSG